jgi:hypothetical protein
MFNVFCLVPVTYHVNNPNSFVWLNSSRPVAPSSCPTYDNWSGGVQSYGTGQYTYNSALVTPSVSVPTIRANYELKSMAYARGLADFGDNSQGDCAPYSQG